MSSKNKQDIQAKHNALHRKRRKERIATHQAGNKTNASGYEINYLIDSVNSPLFEEVNNATKVVLEPSTDNSWGSELRTGKNAVVYCNYPSDAPQACFTHELLHLKFENAGFSCPNFVDDDGIMGNRGKDFVRQFYNDLMHHRMYPIYKEMGYPPHKFLSDSDQVDTRQILENQLPIFEQKHIEKGGLLQNYEVGAAYMMTINSHDADAGIDLADLKQRIINFSTPQLVQGIDALLAEWKIEPNPDCCLFMAKLFRVFGHLNVGFGYKRDQLIWAKNV